MSIRSCYQKRFKKRSKLSGICSKTSRQFPFTPCQKEVMWQLLNHGNSIKSYFVKLFWQNKKIIHKILRTLEYKNNYLQFNKVHKSYRLLKIQDMTRYNQSKIIIVPVKISIYVHNKIHQNLVYEPNSNLNIQLTEVTLNTTHKVSGTNYLNT